eukprot:109970-Pyramimonas_sp.AAC.1
MPQLAPTMQSQLAGVPAKVYFQPGHSRGHTVLVYRDQVMFTGDHLAVLRQTGQLDAFSAFCKC